VKKPRGILAKGIVMRKTVTKLMLASAMLAAAIGLSVRESAAYGDAPWCAVQSLGSDTVVWNCYYWSIEQCRPHVLAGNSGVCMLNPSYPERSQTWGPARRWGHHWRR
jgi:hypothetical protein